MDAGWQLDIDKLRHVDYIASTCLRRSNRHRGTGKRTKCLRRTEYSEKTGLLLRCSRVYDVRAERAAAQRSEERSPTRGTLITRGRREEAPRALSCPLSICPIWPNLVNVMAVVGKQSMSYFESMRNSRRTERTPRYGSSSRPEE